MKSLFIAIDFDGTIVTHKYPEIGKPLDDAIETITDLQEAGHKIILYTMRSGDRLQEAVDYLEEEGIELYGVNENKSQKYWTESPKIFANLYIDDCSLGTPLVNDTVARPYVDWERVREMLVGRGILPC